MQLFEQVFSLSDEANLQSIELYVHRVRKKLAGSDEHQYLTRIGIPIRAV